MYTVKLRCFRTLDPGLIDLLCTFVMRMITLSVFKKNFRNNF